MQTNDTISVGESVFKDRRVAQQGVTGWLKDIKVY